MARVNFEKLIEYWDPVLRKAFLDSVQNIRQRAQLDQIAKAIERGDLNAALEAVGLDPASFRPLDITIQRIYEVGGNATASALPALGKLDSGLRVSFIFNMRNPTAERWINEHSSIKVTEIITDQRVMIREFLTEGLKLGANPRTTALDLVGRVGQNGLRQGGMLGLTSSQAAWVRNYGDKLANGDMSALGSALRDKRYDKLVSRTFEKGDKLSPSQINSMVNAYKNRALRYRAETISRTETMASLHEAQQQAMDQVVQSGKLRSDNVSFTWRSAHDNRTRDTHREMDGQTVKMGEMFVSPSGARLEYPGDPNGPAAEVINCRCWREPNVNFLAGIK